MHEFTNICKSYQDAGWPLFILAVGFLFILYVYAKADVHSYETLQKLYPDDNYEYDLDDPDYPF